MPTYSVSLAEDLNQSVMKRASEKGLSVTDYFRWLAKEDLRKSEEDKG